MVSVEPPPKQGCEPEDKGPRYNPEWSLSGTPAEAGVRVVNGGGWNYLTRRLSGTPAEAGVRE